jgi:hypothetical protein
VADFAPHLPLLPADFATALSRLLCAHARTNSLRPVKTIIQADQSAALESSIRPDGVQRCCHARAQKQTPPRGGVCREFKACCGVRNGRA